MLTPAPMTSDELILTNPAAGVIATNPATAPVTTPRIVAFPCFHHSINPHVRPAVAAAVFVTANAIADSPLADNALPALKPNHPNHNRPPPITVRIRL